jgi:hypothetical protein
MRLISWTLQSGSEQSFLSYPLCPVLAVLLKCPVPHSILSSHILAVLSLLSGPDVLSWLSCLGCPVLAVLSRLSSPCCPDSMSSLYVVILKCILQGVVHTSRPVDEQFYEKMVKKFFYCF